VFASILSRISDKSARSIRGVERSMAFFGETALAVLLLALPYVGIFTHI
jgi:hypothetical protein